MGDSCCSSFFFFNDTATTEIYTLSLHDALPITWWVAHKRYVPWRGNAAQWWWNARAFGFAEGSIPRAGAIMVMGISGTSPQGHVGYIESVNANGSFLVSEMNWWGVPGGGWGRVDYRTGPSLRGILGFIY